MPNGEIVFEMEQYKPEFEQIEVSKAEKTKLVRNLELAGAYPIPWKCLKSGLSC